MKIKALACIAWLLLSGCDQAPAPEDSFAGLGSDAADFAQVVPGKVFSFPEDHGPHDGFRIEWWYVTANLKDASGFSVSSEAYELTVTPRATSVTTNLGLSNAAQTHSLYEGTLQLSASCAPAEASQQVQWSSNNAKVATVDPDTGLVTFLSAGTAVITAAAMDGTGLKATVKLTITK